MRSKIATWFRNSLPVVLTFTGVLIFTVGQFFKFQDSPLTGSAYFSLHWPDYCADIGKAIFISGVAGIILHTFQFMGIFTEEIKKVISHPEYIRNRVDLPEYWENVTKELLKHKFPKINGLIMADVKNGYLPIKSSNYIDKYWQLISIKLIDKNKEIVEVRQTTKYTIVLSDKNQPYDNKYSNTILTGGPGQPKPTFEIVSLLVNGKKSDIICNSRIDGHKLISDYMVTLSGSESYDLELEIKKVYCLKHDNIIVQVNSYIRNNSILKFQLDGVSLEFNEIGTLKNFETNAENSSLIEKEYKGLIYPRQGYMAIIRKK